MSFNTSLELRNHVLLTKNGSIIIGALKVNANSCLTPPLPLETLHTKD